MAGKVHITQITSQRFERQIWPFHGRKVFRYHMKMGHGRPQENEKKIEKRIGKQHLRVHTQEAGEAGLKEIGL